MSQNQDDLTPAKPTPVRTVTAPAGGEADRLPSPLSAVTADPRLPESTEPDGSPRVVSAAEPASLQYEFDGLEWVIEIAGRSGGGSKAAAPVLLLAFSRADQPQERKEMLVVGTSLGSLSDDLIQAAFRAAGPPPDISRGRPFFPQTGEGRRR